MRNVSEAAKINKAVSKVLAVLEKEELEEEQIKSVLRAAEEALGIEPPRPVAPPFPPFPGDSSNKED